MPVQDVGPRTGHRAANRDRAVFLGARWPPAEERIVDRRLGQTVGVDHASARPNQPAQPPVQPPAHRIRAYSQKPDTVEGFSFMLQVGRKGLGQNWYQLHAFNAFAFQ